MPILTHLQNQCPKPGIFWKCFLVLLVFTLQARANQPFHLLVPLPLNPLYVPQYAPSVGVGTHPPSLRLTSSPQVIYYLYNYPVVGLSGGPGLQYIRNEEQGFSQWADDTIERDAPARTPLQDSFLFEGGAPNFQNDQCGVPVTSEGLADVPPRMRTSISEFVRDFSNFRQTNQGSVLLKTLDFDGPNTTDSVLNKYVGRPFILENKITYGIETENKEAPWQVAIFIKGKFHCGASLIGVRHVLTAAHCVTAYKTRPHILELSIGDWDLATTEDGQNVEAKVKKITAHKDFNFFDLQNDIAVLELKDKVEFNERIRPICIPPSDLKIGDVPITITGWGRNERNKLQTRLQKLTAIPVAKSICADRWTETGAPRSIIGAKTICIDTQFGDSCKGDSGGPAIMEYPAASGKYVQAGIVSFGSGSCTNFRLPGVYTLVPLFRDWIVQNMT